MTAENEMTEPPPAEIVEATLLGIVADPETKTVTIRFRRLERSFHASASGVTGLRVHDFIEQNIVDEARILGGTSDASELRDLLAAVLYGQPDAASVIHSGWLAAIDARAEEVRCGVQVLLELTPVYGAYVLLLAERIDWIEDAEYRIEDPHAR
jgi:hypothetical protein